MAFTQIPTYVTNQPITAAHGNSYWRDNINELWPFTAAGDIAYATGATTLAKLAIASVGSVLKSTGTLPAWGAVERIIHWRVVPVTVLVSVGDLQDVFTVPLKLNGCNLVSAHAAVDTVSSSGMPTIQIRNVTNAVDMLSTPITIDANELNSMTAVSPPVINTTFHGVVTGNRIAVDVDVAGTGTKGLTIILVFELP